MTEPTPRANAPRAATEADRAIGTRIAALRKTKGMSQTELGRAIGVTFQQMQKNERGQNRLSAGSLQTIAGALDVPLATLLEAKGPTQGLGHVLDLLKIDGAAGMLQAYAVLDPLVRREALTIMRALARISERSEP